MTKEDRYLRIICLNSWHQWRKPAQIVVQFSGVLKNVQQICVLNIFHTYESGKTKEASINQPTGTLKIINHRF
jgi:hypothetical protein